MQSTTAPTKNNTPCPFVLLPVRITVLRQQKPAYLRKICGLLIYKNITLRSLYELPPMRQQPQQEQVRGVKDIKEKCILPPALPCVGVQQQDVGQDENF